MAEAARRAMRQNTELSNRLEAMTETLHVCRNSVVDMVVVEIDILTVDAIPFVCF